MLKAECFSHTLQFRFLAGTSRGTLTEHTAYYVRIFASNHPEIFGIGEAAPLKGLSLDYHPGFKKQVDLACRMFTENNFSRSEIFDHIPPDLPSLRFAFETALRDFESEGKRIIFDNAFYRNKKKLPINGLIWMGDEQFMQEQIEIKLAEGYNCLKMKIGAINFETERKILKNIRSRHAADELILRVDANGAFSPTEASNKLTQLAELELHSIEQPIKGGQAKAMYELCQTTPLPIALDEELIGIVSRSEKERLLDQIQPQFIILKPTLIGGITATQEWIEVAESRAIGWWITSALESNVGLNAIAQLTAEYDPKLPQGLGTGQLYENNISSPLQVKAGKIWYEGEWEL